jgi:hypothetical protein
MTWEPRTFLALLVAGMGCWLERQAAAQIEYLKAENRLLRSRLGRRRIVFTDAERSTLATLAKEIRNKGASSPRSPRFSCYAFALASGTGRTEMDVSGTPAAWPGRYATWN